MSDDLKAELQRRCEEAGILYNKRWGVDRLEQALGSQEGTENEVEGEDDASPSTDERDDYIQALEEEIETLKSEVVRLNQRVGEQVAKAQAGALDAPPPEAVESDDPAVLKPDHVWVKVTKVGHGKIVAPGYDEFGRQNKYMKGARFQCIEASAHQLEDRNLVEIEEE